MSKNTAASDRCAIILAAGDGLRLRSFVERLRGDALPKQYVQFFGARSLLQSTLARAHRLIPRQRTFTVVNHSHFAFAEVNRQLATQAEPQLVVQPSNRQTALGLLLPLARVLEDRADANVAVFPADHFVSDDNLFMTHVDAAFDIVEEDMDRFVLLGIPPSAAVSDYGYIVAGDCSHRIAGGARRVSRFVEKPAPGVAREIVASGGLWNTLVMIFSARAFLRCVRAINAELYDCYRRIREALGMRRSAHAIGEIYASAPQVDLSKGILEELPKRFPSRLLVLPVRDVYWCDCGSEERMVNLLSHAAQHRRYPDKPSHNRLTQGG